MRRWTTPLLGVLAVRGGAAADPATLALWPQHLDTELSVSHSAGALKSRCNALEPRDKIPNSYVSLTDGQTIVEASNGGALGTFNVKIDAHSEVY